MIIDDNPDIHQDFIKILKIKDQDNEFYSYDKALFDEEHDDVINELPDFEIESSSQGAEGIAKIKKALEDDRPFALAFVDIRMPPGIDGIETIKRIWECDPSIQIVICTAYSDYTWKETVKALGLNDNLLVLKKPFDIAVVRQLTVALTRKWLSAQETKQTTLSLNQLVTERTESLTQSLALLRATIDSSFDAILVVDLNGKIIDLNKQFVKFFQLPDILLEQNNPTLLLQHLLSQMEEPDKYMMMVNSFSKKKDSSSREVLKLNNKQIVECYSKPHQVGGQIVGRVWSFHDITEQIHLKEKLEYQANHDTLTELPNRLLLLDRLRQEIERSTRDKTQFAVLFLDLDRFKFINDNLSHEIGDQLLCEIAKRISTNLRKVDTVARLGGDEFVIVIPLIKNEEHVITVAQKLIGLFKHPFQASRHQIKITTSIGISIYPNDGMRINTLLSKADLAMYEAKARGGDYFVFYTEELNRLSEYQYRMESEIQRALSNNEFFLAYQPQFEIENQQIISIEALIRWLHPEKGVLLPKDFLPAAENNGLIIPIGEWVLHEACQQMMIWHKMGMKWVTLGINVTAKQIRQHEFSNQVEKILNVYGFDPKYLAIEVIENILHDQDIQYSIARLKEIGCKIVLDDFGTGISSINSLKKIPIDGIKIDPCFVNNISKSTGDETIVQAIIAISHSLGSKVIAEGVETQNQVDFLKKSHCDVVQGFVWGKPLTRKEFELLIKKRIID